MSRLLPFKSETTRTPDGATVLSLEDDATDEALSALSSATAREILSLVYEEPRTPPEIRDEIETSLQNVHYHLENLEDAGLIQPAGSGYSEKGTEMTVYAPASEAVVLFAGREGDRSRLKTALTRLLGAVGLLALASFVVRRFAQTSDVSETGFEAQRADGDGSGDGGDGGGGAAGDAAGGTPEPTGEAPEDAADMEADTSTPTEGAVETGTPTPADTATPEPTGTVEQLDTPTPSPAATGTPQPTSTPGPTGTPTPTPQPTGTPTPTPQPTGTPTATPVERATETPTELAASNASGSPVPAAGDGGGATPTPEPADAPVDTTFADEALRAAGDGGLLSDPAVTFFLGGAFMLAVVGVWWYYAYG